MKGIILIIGISFWSLLSFAQNECGTERIKQYIIEHYKSNDSVYLPPWHGNNKLLNDILEKNGYFEQKNNNGSKSYATCNNNIRYLVPVDIIIWHNRDGSNSPIGFTDLNAVFQRV